MSVDEFASELTNCLSVDEFAQAVFSHTNLRQTDEWNNFYPICLAVTQPTRARRATSHT
jgi:hypothetical protein